MILLFESFTNTYSMYTGVSKSVYEKVWKNKNITDRLTNVTSDFDLALGYSYDFNTGKYDDIVVEIENIPIDAFKYYRDDEYEDDDDVHSMEDMSIEDKIYYIENYSLFEVYLYPYKDEIKINLIWK